MCELGWLGRLFVMCLFECMVVFSMKNMMIVSGNSMGS